MVRDTLDDWVYPNSRNSHERYGTNESSYGVKKEFIGVDDFQTPSASSIYLSNIERQAWSSVRFS